MVNTTTDTETTAAYRDWVEAKRQTIATVRENLENEIADLEQALERKRGALAELDALDAGE